MIRLLSLLAIAFAASGPQTAHAAFDFDGCFQLYRPNVMYPAFCLDGTKEEGINGAGARLVIFGTNTDRIIACGKSSALGGGADSLEFIQNGKKELILKNVKLENGRLVGDAVLGKTELNFIQVKEESKRLLGKFYDDKRCEDLEIGELRNLR
jgi:hypothetical protein